MPDVAVRPPVRHGLLIRDTQGRASRPRRVSASTRRGARDRRGGRQAPAGTQQHGECTDGQPPQERCAQRPRGCMRQRGRACWRRRPSTRAGPRPTPAVGRAPRGRGSRRRRRSRRGTTGGHGAARAVSGWCSRCRHRARLVVLRGAEAGFTTAAHAQAVDDEQRAVEPAPVGCGRADTDHVEPVECRPAKGHVGRVCYGDRNGAVESGRR